LYSFLDGCRADHRVGRVMHRRDSKTAADQVEEISKLVDDAIGLLDQAVRALRRVKEQVDEGPARELPSSDRSPDS
jgi:hypothetical protein